MIRTGTYSSTLNAIEDGNIKPPGNASIRFWRDPAMVVKGQERYDFPTCTTCGLKLEFWHDLKGLYFQQM
jgi:hypothetical protein